MCYSHLFCKANDGLLLLSIAFGHYYRRKKKTTFPNAIKKKWKTH